LIWDYTVFAAGVPDGTVLTAPRIIYVSGMKPKPPPDEHSEALRRCLCAGLSRYRPTWADYLDRNPEQFTLVSWTFDFYGAYRDMALDRRGIEALLARPDPTPEEIREIDSLARRLKRLWHLFGDSLPLLSRVFARPDLRVTLGEVRRYLHEDEVGRAVRAPLKDALVRAWGASEPVLLIGHSLGSVIAYDSLWELSREERVNGTIDWLVTLGSPLATRFVRKAIKGVAQTGPQRYPDNIRRWLNCSAHGEMTALHPRLQPFFGGIVKLGLCEALIDRADIYNHFQADFGINVHKSYGYLAHESVAHVVADWLTESLGAPPKA